MGIGGPKTAAGKARAQRNLIKHVVLAPQSWRFALHLRNRGSGMRDHVVDYP